MKKPAHKPVPNNIAPGEDPLPLATDDPTLERLAYSLEEAALVLRLSHTTVWRLTERGELPYNGTTRRRLIPKAALLAFANRTKGSKSAAA